MTDTPLLGRAEKVLAITLKLLARDKVGLAGLLMVSAFVLISFAGPLIVPIEMHIEQGTRPPSLRHFLGTNSQGQDNLIQLIHGGKDVITIAFVAGFLTTLIAVAVGMYTAFVGGLVDNILVEMINTWLLIPKFPLVALLAWMIKVDSVWALAILIALLDWPGLALQVRSQVFSLKKQEYVEAAMLLDMGGLHVAFREILPNMMTFITISSVLAMTGTIYQQTGLILLGLATFPPANWGMALRHAYVANEFFLSHCLWNWLTPTVAIVLFQLSLVWTTRALEQVFNPRLRTSA